MNRAVLLPLAMLTLATTAAAPELAASPRSVQLSKVILDSAGAGPTIRFKVGTICLFGGGKISFDQEKVTQNHERFDNLFRETMKGRGYTVVSTDADLFAGEGNSPKGDYLVGATLHVDDLDLCSSIKGEKGSITMSVEWKLFDRAAQKIVATATTSGRGAQEKFAPNGLKRMMDAAFVASLNGFVEQPPVQSLVGQPMAAKAG